MTSDLIARTTGFALRVIRLTQELPRDRAAEVIGRQLLRCGTSVGANYRAACRARSRRDFVSKLAIVEEECDESLYWIDLLIAAGLAPATRVAAVRGEADELLRIVVASAKTAKRNARTADTTTNAE
jgi:four helix bundle protein